MNSLPHRAYGRSGLSLSAVGLGAGQIGDPALSETGVETLLLAALDAGVTLFDTAPSYGLSEQRIGRHLASRRDDFVLSTKLGYGVAGVPDWTGTCITAGVEQALRVLHTDHLDIAHLHSCPRDVLARGEVTEALARAKQAGKIRAIAYSGENDDLAYALTDSRFDGFMASLNLCDQRVLETVLPALKGRGFIAKRPTANHPWRFRTLPEGDYCEEYWRRWQSMAIDPQGLAWGELALRFALTAPAVSSAIVGTSQWPHLRQSLQWAEAGSLPSEQYQSIRATFQEKDQDWLGQI